MTTVARTSATHSARSRWGRSLGAVAAGLLINVVLSSATDLLLVALGIFPPLTAFDDPAAYTDSLLLLALLYRSLFGVFSCYVAARLARTQPMAHALALGCIGVVIGSLGAMATWDTWTHWYSLAIVAVALPCGWLGGWIVQSRRAASSV